LSLGGRTRPAAILLAALVLTLGAGCSGSGNPRPDLLFVSSRSGVYALYAMNADGGRQKRFSHVPKAGSVSRAQVFFQEDPSWSPRGNAIAFASGRSGTSQIFVTSAAGRGVRQLTHGRENAQSPAWSPDGRTIAYVVGSNPRLYAMRANGAGQHLLGGGGASQTDPAWSPDGTRIAYVRRESGSELTELWVMRSDGTRPRRLTHLQAHVTSPSWSPDGKRIVFAADLRQHYELYVVPATGGLPVRRTTSPSDDLEPSWSPDGKLIAFTRDGSIMTVDASGTIVSLTSSKNNDSNPVWNPVQPSSEK
jgi:TolB protein